MRDLSADRNVAEVKDAISGLVHELYFRTPTTSERVKYQAGLFERKNNKVYNRILQQREKFGALVMTGFKKGTFSVDGSAISSDSDDPQYFPKWKDLLKKGAPDQVAVIGRLAFEGAEAVHRNPEPTEIIVEEIEDDLGE